MSEIGIELKMSETRQPGAGNSQDDVRKTLDAVYASESRRIFASLIRLLGDFDLAEEALHDAFTAALEQWPRDGVPANPRTWLISAGRFKAIDRVRRRTRFDTAIEDIVEQLTATEFDQAQIDERHLEDDRLRLIFVCCHPALPQEAQIALTLREVCGLTTEEVARAFLTNTPVIAKRIVRAKAKIRDARIPYEVPKQSELAARLDSVLCVIYLIFTEGYAASSGSQLARADLTQEAVRLGRLLNALLDEPETIGLLALMLLQESRYATRLSAEGEIVLLDEQDRSQWDQPLIKEGIGLVEKALALRRIGPYTLQAAIAAVHAESASPELTDWKQIAALYDLLQRINPTPVVELNRAVAIAQYEGPASGLALVDAILERGDLKDYYLAHATRADFCMRLGRVSEAIESYRQALALARQEPARRFLERQLTKLEKG
jgi:RNA polymerase sigma-70 factor, ECF subfamily